MDPAGTTTAATATPAQGHGAHGAVPFTAPATHPHGHAPSRYEALLHQIVQLNTDLQKTAALSQSLQHERDGLQANNHKLKDEVKRLHERCDKLQHVLMQETEQKIESDKKHEELIAKWKRQLELKARAFESLQKKFAPPRDLEHLRMQIQEELEQPHQQRVAQLQAELEHQREAAFALRRDYEVLKTEYEQFAADQGGEMEAMHAAHELQLSEARRQRAVAEERARDAMQTDATRRLEQQKNAALVEVQLLQQEIRDVREAGKRATDVAAKQQAEAEARLADELARAATLELDLKALARQLARVKDDADSLRAKWDHAQAQSLELTTDNDKLREQLKQKDQLVLHSHHAVSAKLREERESSERERAALQARVNELVMKLQAAEQAVQRLGSGNRSGGGSGSGGGSTDDELSAQHAAVLRSRDDEIAKLRQLAAAMERKVADREDQIRAAQSEAEDAAQRVQTEHEHARQTQQALDTEREQAASRHAAAQELLAKVKSECVLLRTKLKEVEADYRTLQAKHRDTLQIQDDTQLAKEQLETKLQFVETDCAVLREKLDQLKEDHVAVQRELQRHCAALEAEAASQRAALRQEMRSAVTKALRELSRTQKKRDAYKHKCLDLHERYKQLVDELQFVEARALQMKHDHAGELQLVLAQLTQVENDKTALLQRQMEALASPSAATTATTAR